MTIMKVFKLAENFNMLMKRTPLIFVVFPKNIYAHNNANPKITLQIKNPKISS